MNEFFFDHSPGILTRTNLAGVILHANREAQRVFGKNSLEGQSLQELVHAEDQAAFAARWAETSTSGASVRAESRFHAGGSFQRLAWTAQRAPDRDEVHAVLVPLTNAEKRLGDPVLSLRGLLDTCAFSLCVVDLTGKLVVHDGKGLVSAGVSPGQFLGQSIFELYEALLPEPMGNIRKTMVDGESRSWKVEVLEVFWEASCFALRDERGTIIGAGVGTIDKSSEKRTMVDLQNKLEVIERQQEVIRNLETPIIQVWDRVLTLPMIGVVDSQRAARVMNDLLNMVSSKGAHYAILDLTGVDTVDTATALHLFNMIDAIRLLGAEGIISGIRPTVAQTMVALGLDLSKVKTCANLQAALKLCIRRMMAASKMPDDF
jgi:rsbT co-antagonist protein RsbR